VDKSLVSSKLEELVEAQRFLDERLTALENRMQAAETLASRIPGVEARIGRIERLVMEVQGEVRKLSFAFDERVAAEVDSFRKFEMKLDRLLEKFDHINRAVTESGP
jgi:DNA repair ATPase RecN